MLPQRRPRQSRVVAGSTDELHWNPELTHAAGDPRAVERDDHLAVAHELGLERLVELKDGLQAAVVLGGELLPFPARACLEELDDLRVGLGAGPFELALDQLLAPYPPTPGLPELGLERAKRDPAVGALVGPVTDQRARERQPPAAGHGAVGEVRAGDHRQPGERAIGHRDVDDLALAGAGLRGSPATGLRGGAVALAQRGEDAEGAHQRAAPEIGDLPGGLNGRPPTPPSRSPVSPSRPTRPR